MTGLLRTVAQVAKSDVTVLIRGETGTGKELIARALHVNSGRSQKPLVTVLTVALAGNVLESELFGHVRGAFTGAIRDRAGWIASAQGGTLFLDEVAEIAPEVQAKLLRFLESGEIQRVGSDRTEKVDARIVAATHRDLEALIREGRFRQDLYHRLKVIELRSAPPPRARRRRSAARRPLHPPILEAPPRRPALDPRRRARARDLRLPGQRAGARARGRARMRARDRPDLDVDLLPAELRAGAAGAAVPCDFVEYTHDELEAALGDAQNHVEASFLTGLMERHAWNVSKAARASGIHRGQLHKLLSRHKITHP